MADRASSMMGPRPNDAGGGEVVGTCQVCKEPEGEHRVVLTANGWQHLDCWGSNLEAQGCVRVEPSEPVDVERYRNAGQLQVQLAIAGQPAPWGNVYDRAALKKLHGRKCRLHVTPDYSELWLIVDGPITIETPKETPG